MAHSLGNFDFIEWHRPATPAAPPLRPTERGTVVQRPGVDDSGAIRSGKKGRPFSMRSGVDVLSHAAGQDLAKLYEQSALADAYILVWADVNYKTKFNVKYIVLEVETTSIRRIASAVGGLNDNPSAWVEADWVLLPVSA